MTVHHPRHDRDKRTLRDMATAGLVIRDGGAEHDRQRRIKAHRLVDEAAEIYETRKVLWGRRTGTEHGSEFGMEALLRSGIARRGADPRRRRPGAAAREHLGRVPAGRIPRPGGAQPL